WQALWVLEERAIVKRRAVTACRVLEPAANQVGPFDRLAKQRQPLLGDLAQLFGCRVIRGGRLEQEADLVEAEPGSLRGLDHRERPHDGTRVAAPAADPLRRFHQADLLVVADRRRSLAAQPP